VGYVQGQTIRLGLTLAVNTVLTVDTPNTTISGHSSSLGGDCVAKGITIPAGQSSIPITCIMNAPLPSSQTRFFDPLTIDWSYSNGVGPSIFIGSTSNQVYVTLTKPLQYNPDPNFPKPVSPLYRTTLHLALSQDGATDQITAFQNTWNSFSTAGTGPKNVKTWDGRPLYYYRNDNHTVGFKSVFCPSNSLDEGVLLEVGDSSGQCTTFAVLMMEALRVNGIAAHEIGIVTNEPPTGFLVKHWLFSSTHQRFSEEPEYKWQLLFNPEATNPGDPSVQADSMVPSQPAGIYGDLSSSPTVPGQNSTPPSEKAFGSHFIVEPILTGLSTSYYDPSYGLTYTNHNNFEDVAVDGYFRKLDPDTALDVSSGTSNHYHAKKSFGLHIIRFINLDTTQDATP